MQFPLPENEGARLESLRSYRVLDTPPEQAFDDLTRLAAYICGVPIAFLGFVDVERLWFKSRIGWDVPEVPREMSFCSHTILQSDVLVVSDTLEDRGRLAECLLATHGGVRFYAGATLLSNEGYALGTLCAMDSMPRGLTVGQIEALRKLSRQAVNLLESRKTAISSRSNGVPNPDGELSQGQQIKAQRDYVLDHAPDAILEIDQESKILFANRATEYVFGYRPEDVVGHSLTMLMPTTSRQRHLESIRQYLGTGKKHFDWRAIELCGLHKNGQDVPLEISIAEFPHQGTRTFIAVCRDVQRRERTNQERSRLAAIIASSADAIFAEDLQGNITEWNEGAERTYGYRAEEIVGKSIFTLAAPEMHAEIASILETVSRGDRIEQHETIRVKKDGTRFQISLSVSPIRDSAGKIVGASIVARDITAQKRAQDRLRHSEQRLLGIIDSAMDAIITIDGAHRIVVFNRAAEAIFHCSATDALGQSIDKFIPQRFQTSHREHIQSFAKTGVTSRSMYSPGTLYAVRADGEEFPIEASISQMDAEGERLFTVILRDVSARLQMEAELRQAQKIEAIGQLAGGVAHEFNNFLGVILGYSDLLAEEAGDNEDLRNSVGEITAATQHAASLTRQLLAFGRRQVLEPQVVDLNQSIWEAHKLLRRLVPANVEVVPLLGPAIGKVKLDPGHVQQMLINLVVNARDAMPEGGRVSIETSEIDVDKDVSAQAGPLPGRYVLLSIGDTGSGMDAETRSHLFEPFYTTKGPGQGTGLGLSTVYGIVKNSGGHISVETEKGRGTIFRIYLPAVREAGLRPELAVMAPKAEQPSGWILVVEDEAALRHLLSVSLQRRGYNVLTAKDGVEALETFRQQRDPIRLVVTDLMMPRMDGFELRRQIAAIEPGVKFLFMSGYSEQFVEQKKESLAGCDFLEKPFLPAQLAEKVLGLLGDQAAA